MKIVLMIVGALLGAAMLEWPGIVFGAVIGWLIGAYLEVRHELRALRDSFTDLADLHATGRTDVDNTSRAAVVTTKDHIPTSASIDEPIDSSVNALNAPPTAATAEQRVIKDTEHYASAWQPAAAQPRNSTSGPTFIDTAITTAIEWIKNYFTGGNTLVRVGAIIVLRCGFSTQVRR